jgi:xanthine dehydrogenase accessory factor
MSLIVLLRGGGDIASGVALRLYRAGIRLIITELPEPLVVRRLVSFGEAVPDGVANVEGVTARRAGSLDEAFKSLQAGDIPVIVDPQMAILPEMRGLLSPPIPIVLVDGRMTKKTSELRLDAADLVIGLGPGFVAGLDCHAVVETNRGPQLGRVIWQGSAESDTGAPEIVGSYGDERVLRAPVEGVLATYSQIGEHLEPGQPVAEVGGCLVEAPFRGVLRGLLRPGLLVQKGMKIGDLDPRNDPRWCNLVSDKALAVGGGVLEAILARQDLRPFLWV